MDRSVSLKVPLLFHKETGNYTKRKIIYHTFESVYVITRNHQTKDGHYFQEFDYRQCGNIAEHLQKEKYRFYVWMVNIKLIAHDELLSII